MYWTHQLTLMFLMGKEPVPLSLHIMLNSTVNQTSDFEMHFLDKRLLYIRSLIQIWDILLLVQFQYSKVLKFKCNDI